MSKKERILGKNKIYINRLILIINLRMEPEPENIKLHEFKIFFYIIMSKVVIEYYGDYSEKCRFAPFYGENVTIP